MNYLSVLTKKVKKIKIRDDLAFFSFSFFIFYTSFSFILFIKFSKGRPNSNGIVVDGTVISQLKVRICMLEMNL